MLQKYRQKQLPDSHDEEACFDDLMASLFVLITHHSLTQCQASLTPIVERLNSLCGHSEIEHYPQQLKVLAKMRQLWRTRLFDAQYSQTTH